MHPGGLRDVRITVQASLGLCNHEMYDQARRKLSAEVGMRLSNEDMLIHVSRLIPTTDADGNVEGRTKVLHSPFQLIVHQDSKGTRVHTARGEVELDLGLKEAQRLVEQAELVPADRAVADPDAETPEWLRRRVLARDNQKCRNCGQSIYLHVHHVEFRGMGGKTEAHNLVAVCGVCHALVHKGLLVVREDDAGGFVFLDRIGVPVNGGGAGLSGSTVAAAKVVPALPVAGARTCARTLAQKVRVRRSRRLLAPSPELGSWAPWQQGALVEVSSAQTCAPVDP